MLPPQDLVSPFPCPPRLESAQDPYRNTCPQDVPPSLLNFLRTRGNPKRLLHQSLPLTRARRMGPHLNGITFFNEGFLKLLPPSAPFCPPLEAESVNHTFFLSTSTSLLSSGPQFFQRDFSKFTYEPPHTLKNFSSFEPSLGCVDLPLPFLFSPSMICRLLSVDQRWNETAFTPLVFRLLASHSGSPTPVISVVSSHTQALCSFCFSFC